MIRKPRRSIIRKRAVAGKATFDRVLGKNANKAASTEKSFDTAPKNTDSVSGATMTQNENNCPSRQEQTDTTSQPDPHVCARCAEVHTTCCFVNPGDEEYCFPLSDSEWERIVEYCDHSGGFAEQRNTQPFIDTLNKLFPNDKDKLAAIFPPHGTHRTLASRKDGPCYFLTDKGCSLPREVRPWYCRLYPFWVRSGLLTMFTSMGCLVCRESKTIPDALEQVGMTQKEVRRIFGQLRIAWGLDPEDNQL